MTKTARFAFRGSCSGASTERGAFLAGVRIAGLCGALTRRRYRLRQLAVAVFVAFALQAPLHAANSSEEQRLIAVLQSGASPAEKDAACVRLKLIGTSTCIPALASLLTDEQLSHSARYALEPMPLPEAGQALVDALAKTKGLTEAGIIYSLGVRGELQAVPALTKCLKNSDPMVASAAAAALGQMGGTSAIKALKAAAGGSTESLHAAAVDGLLRCANRFLAANDLSNAHLLFEQLYSSEKTDGIRLAAYRGMILTGGPRAVDLMIQGITGEAGPAQITALQLVPMLKAPALTEALSGLLPKLQTQVQLALIEGLEQRGDPAALPGLVSLTGTVSTENRVVLIQALAALGDSSVTAPLAEFAASGSPAEQKAARQGLVDLRRGEITRTLVKLLETSKPAVQSELARGLGSRDDKAAVPQLLELAKRGSDSAHKAALDALALLIDPEQLPALLTLVVNAKNPSARSDAVTAVNSACQRLQTRRGAFAAEPLAQAVTSGSAETRVALLPVCSGLTQPQVRAALRACVKDSDMAVRTAALRVLCDSVDPGLLEDVVSLAGSTQDEKIKELAINGAVRLASAEEGPKRSSRERVTTYKSLLAAANRSEEKRMILAGLEEVSDTEALALVEPMLQEKDVQTEAARAVARIAPSLPGNAAPMAQAALGKALAATTDSATHQAVQAALQEIEARADYLTDWQVSGPYRQNGKDYAGLFDIVFPPEIQSGAGAKWQPLPASADAKGPGVMDLLKALGGEQCVAYARTWVHSDQDEPALLELGSDDGVKVWFNDKQIYALNVSRPLQPGSDKVNLQLHSGWNLLLLKITQNNQGWAFCARLRRPDGSRMAGLHCEASPQKVSK
jgi:HEAT repeat protein